MESVRRIRYFERNEIFFNDITSQTVELLYKEGVFSYYFTLIAIIEDVLMCNSIYTHYYAVTSSHHIKRLKMTPISQT
jgi:hypothetical protein